MKRIVLLGLFFTCAVFWNFGADFGLTLHQNPELNGAAGETDIVYNGGLGSWVSLSLNEKTDIYLSGSFAIKHESENWFVVPEINRFMVTWRPLSVLAAEGGRIRFNDNNRILTAGLFDGLSGSWELGPSRLTFGAYYTGFLYKDTADIFMSAGDTADYIKELDYHNFGNTYFASRRFLASAEWEVPSIRNSAHSLSLQGLAQFDLNAREEKIHTQYLSCRFLYTPVSSFDLNLGGIVGLAELTGPPAGTEINFALLIDASWMPPTPLRDMIGLAFHWGSGRVNETVGPFRPVTTVDQGNVLDGGLPGLMAINAAYTMQPLDGLSASLDIRYFLRSDVATYTNPNLKSTNEKALGPELYISAAWVPMVDVSLTAGCGAFFPGMGNAFNSDAPVLWKTELALLLSF